MPRMPRIVVPGHPHHVTQRGNRRMTTFYEPADYRAYIDDLAAACAGAGTQVLAWCLMPNHVHLVLVPSHARGLAAALSKPHQNHAWRINRRHGWQGHLWQARCHSTPLDDEHLIAAVRYVELNPQRARLVATPEAWPWSSAAARIARRADALVAARPSAPLDTVGDWRAYLAADDSVELEAARIRAAVRTGRPLGAPAFIAPLEARTARHLTPKPRGRPRLDGRENRRNIGPP